jgi:hypothetical protein
VGAIQLEHENAMWEGGGGGSIEYSDENLSLKQGTKFVNYVSENYELKDNNPKKLVYFRLWEISYR